MKSHIGQEVGKVKRLRAVAVQSEAHSSTDEHLTNWQLISEADSLVSGLQNTEYAAPSFVAALGSSSTEDVIVP